MRILIVALLFLSTTAFAEQFDRKTWRGVKVYDMPELQKLDPPPLGHIVGVKFNYRHEHIEQPHARWYLGSIWRVVRDAQKADFMHINVMVREADLAAFQAITTDFHSSKNRVVYGEPMYYRDYLLVPAPDRNESETWTKRHRQRDVVTSPRSA